MLKKYLYNLKFLILIVVICNILATVAMVFTPYLTKVLFDSIAEGKGSQILWLIIMYIGCNIVSLIFTYFETLFTWKQSIRFEMLLKQDFFKAITNYSYKKFSSRDIGQYISLQGNEITQLEMDYLTPLMDIIKSINSLIIYGIMFFAFINWKIALIMLLCSIISTLVGPNITSKKLSKKRKAYLDKMGEYVSKIKDLLEGFKLITDKTRKNVILEQEKFLKNTAEYRFKYGKFKTLACTINGAFVYVMHIIAFALVGYLLFKKEITIGTAVATFGYLECFINPIESLIYDINTINSTKDIKKKVLEFLNNDDYSTELIKKDLFNSNIKFDNVNIKYENFSLNNFSYIFEKGKKYAIIGHSGSGKSTILNALMKYIDLDTGNIFIDDENIKNLNTDNLIFSISQNEHIFASDFKNNVTIFKSYPLIQNIFLTEGLNEKMIKSIEEKENCQLLSGGEKQVVSIKRIFSANAPIWIMDEVFSATDMNTTKKIQQNLMSINDKTIIMITHKLSEDLSDFDEILIMENGKLVQSGSYDEIYKSKSFMKLQSVL